jgi:hypothetical protein
MFIARWARTILSNGVTDYGTTDSMSIFSEVFGTATRHSTPSMSDKITYKVEVSIPELAKPQFSASSEWSNSDGEKIWKLEFTCEQPNAKTCFQVVFTPCLSELKSHLKASHSAYQIGWEVSTPTMTDVLNMRNVKQESIPHVIAQRCTQAFRAQVEPLVREDPERAQRHLDWFWTLDLRTEMVDLIYGFVSRHWRLEQKRNPGEKQ